MHQDREREREKERERDTPNPENKGRAIDVFHHERTSASSNSPAEKMNAGNPNYITGRCFQYQIGIQPKQGRIHNFPHEINKPREERLKSIHRPLRPVREMPMQHFQVKPRSKHQTSTDVDRQMVTMCTMIEIEFILLITLEPTPKKRPQ